MIQLFWCYDEVSIYRMGWKCKILAKNNIVNRFRQQKDKPDDVRIRQVYQIVYQATKW